MDNLNDAKKIEGINKVLNKKGQDIEKFKKSKKQGKSMHKFASVQEVCDFLKNLIIDMSKNEKIIFTENKPQDILAKLKEFIDAENVISSEEIIEQIHEFI